MLDCQRWIMWLRPAFRHLFQRKDSYADAGIGVPFAARRVMTTNGELGEPKGATRVIEQRPANEGIRPAFRAVRTIVLELS